MLGTIQITIISAKLTHDTETFGKMDPYCALTLKSATLKTEIHKGGGKFPSWKQNFGIRTTDVSDIIEFEVWDHDAMSKDDLVGVGYILVSHLVESLDKKEEWFPLSYKDKKAGEVLISFQFFPDYINVQEIPFIPNPCPVQPPYGYVNPSRTIFHLFDNLNFIYIKALKYSFYIFWV